MLEPVWPFFSASGFFRGERERLPETGSSPGAVAQGGEAGSDVHAHHLIGQQGDHAEHQMTEHFPTAAHPDMLGITSKDSTMRKLDCWLVDRCLSGATCLSRVGDSWRYSVNRSPVF